MTQSFDNFDKPYRRGLVLGLSLAEVFLILLFLLLLAAIGLTSSLQEELNDTENKRQELQDSLDAFREVIGNKITVEEFTRLQKNAAARQKLIRENQALSDQLAAAEKALAKVNDVIEVLKKNNIKPGDLKNIIEGKDTLAEALSKKASIEEKLKEIQLDMDKLKKQLMDEQIKTELAKSKLAESQKKVTDIAKILDSITDKGRSPPCWFRLVADKKSGPNSKRQKDVKIFDVQIEDDGFYVIKHNNKNTPNPIDFGNEGGLPTYPEKLFNKKLSAKKFKYGFNAFFLAGEANKIQPYKCAFTVDLYDNTSETNKKGYKRNKKIVEGMFVTYDESGKWPLR
jgi:hypothetical protein